MGHGELVDCAMAELEAVDSLASHLCTDQEVADELVHTTFELAFRSAPSRRV